MKNSKAKKETKKEAPNIASIYANPDGSLPDLTQLDTKPKGRIFLWVSRILASFLLIGGLVFAAWWTWSNVLFSPPQRLESSVVVPPTIVSGEPFTLRIKYENTGEVGMHDIDMTFHTPPGFSILDTNPLPTTAQDWHIGNLLAGEKQEITINGFFRSEVPSTETLQAFFSYTPDNVNSPFQTISTTTASINASAITLEITGPEKVLAGDEVTYTINTVSKSSKPLTGVSVQITLPEGFQTLLASPELSEKEENTWLIENLDNNIYSATITGQYTSDQEGLQTIKTTAYLNEKEGRLFQTETETQTDVIGGALQFSLIGNGGKDRIILDQKDRLFLSIPYKNTGLENVGGVSFTLSLNPFETEKFPPIDWENADLAGGERSGNTITWNEELLPTLAVLSPQTEGTLDLSLPLLPGESKDTFSDAWNIVLEGHFANVGSIESPRTIQSLPIEVVINTDLTSKVEARYFSEDGEAIGSGPLPPTPKQTTTYRFIWQINNSWHALEKIQLSTNLPPGVVWNGRAQTTIGNVTFDDQTRVLTWKIESLPISIPEATASLDLSISPEESDIGSFIKLTNATSIQATDTVTKSNINQALDIVTTEIPNDTEGAGKGVVVEGG